MTMAEPSPFAARFVGALKESLWRSVPVYLGLSTIAIAQPMLDLYGKNLPVFSTAKVSRYEVAAFLVLMVVLPTIVACGVEFIARLVRPRSGDRVRLGFVGLFGALFLMTLARQMGIDSLVVVAAVALIGATGLTMGYRKIPLVKTFVGYLAIAAPVVSGVFVMNAQPILFPSELPIASNQSVATPGTERPPIVLVVLDEAPLYSLLDGEGNINSERYPNLARLSTEATWHRNATGVSNWTAQAVPAIFTSQFPEQGDLPLASVHPRNIFTALADSYPMNVFEPITSLCPTTLCKSVVPVGERWNNQRFRAFLKDALVVFGHRVLPGALRDNLPRIDEGWGGFAGAGEDEAGDNEEERMSVLRAYGVLGPVYQSDLMAEQTRRMARATVPEAYISHFLVPHRPWKATPDERVYATHSPDVPQDVVPADLDQRRTLYQRYLLQMSMVDTALGTMINDMKQAGVWDKSLVIITADHGLTLEVDTKMRQAVFDNPAITDDLYRVPMFVKLPQQKAGSTTDCTVSVLDVLPTILSVARIDTGWEFEGRDISSDCPRDASRRITSPSGSGSFTNPLEVLFERSRHYDGLVGRSGGPGRIAAVGSSAGLVGQQLETNTGDAGVLGWSFSELPMFADVPALRGSKIPVHLKGTVRLGGALPAGAEGIITIDGVGAGVITELSGAASEIVFDAIINYELLTGGPHEVGLVINWDGTGRDLRRAPRPTP